MAGHRTHYRSAIKPSFSNKGIFCPFFVLASFCKFRAIAFSERAQGIFPPIAGASAGILFHEDVTKRDPAAFAVKGKRINLEKISGDRKPPCPFCPEAAFAIRSFGRCGPSKGLFRTNDSKP
jgi:hypothetical protein